MLLKKWVSFALAASFLLLAPKAHGQNFVRLIGGDQTLNRPASASNPVPVTATNDLSNTSTYGASTPVFTPAATPTDVVTLIGSASKTIKVLKVSLSNVQTATGSNKWTLIKYTTPSTGGTTTAMSAAKMDSTSAAASASCVRYTANPAGIGTGTAFYNAYILAPATASAAQTDYVLYDASTRGQPLTLRGTSETMSLNFAGAAVPAGYSMTVNVIWTEE
jgi:hypothetical protein